MNEHSEGSQQHSAGPDVCTHARARTTVKRHSSVACGPWRAHPEAQVTSRAFGPQNETPMALDTVHSRLSAGSIVASAGCICLALSCQ